MGGRGKDKPKKSQTKATRRRQKYPKLSVAKLKGAPSGSRAKQNQGKTAHLERRAKNEVRRATKTSQAL